MTWPNPGTRGDREVNVKATSQRSVLESPWYWGYVFCAAGLVGLLVMGPKVIDRQVQQERSFQGRQRAEERKAGVSPETTMSTRAATLLDLRPLFLLLITGFLMAWFMVWWHYLRRRRVGQNVTRRP